MRERVGTNEAEWRRKLTPEQYRITRQKGTEPAYSGKYCSFGGTGTYPCVCCGNALFSSEAKYSIKAKWPTFWSPAKSTSVKTAREIFHFMVRKEVSCNQCDAHLGYVFEDGRPPTGVRYFINSAALVFLEKRREQEVLPSLCPIRSWPARVSPALSRHHGARREGTSA